MKRILIWAAVAVVVLVVAVALGISLFLDSAVKRGVETVAPRLTKTDVKLDKVRLSVLSGSGTVQGFVLGNPEGYKSPSAIQVGKASLALSPGSLLSDKVVVRSINVLGPEITFETDLKGNNLSKIIANLNEATGGSQEASADKSASRKLQVDEFLVTGVRFM
jgi:uncharacterized protein involved in outer membrane biogenesis